jgi:hypothetical protein
MATKRTKKVDVELESVEEVGAVSEVRISVTLEFVATGKQLRVREDQLIPALLHNAKHEWAQTLGSLTEADVTIEKS